MSHLLRAGLLIVLGCALLAACSSPAGPTPTTTGSAPPSAFLDGEGEDFSVFLIEEACWSAGDKPCYDNQLGSTPQIFVQGTAGGALRVRFDEPYPASGSVTLTAKTFDGEAVTAWELALTDGAMDITLPDDLAPGEYAIEVQAVWAEPAGNTATYHLGVIVNE